jgi:two-component system OmpR family sensor kinase
MSLRLRLLLASSAVALVALVAADVATYRSLRTFLYRRVDQSLFQSHIGLERMGGDRHGGHGGPGFDDRGVLNAAPGTYVEYRDADGNREGVPTPARLAGGEELTPELPAQFTGLRSYANDPQEPTKYMTVRSSDHAVQFRARISERPGGGLLIIAVPLTDTIATLHRLLAVEAAVTAAALLAALGLGFWLVRVGLRPLVSVEETAVAIADGQLDRRVPGDDARTEVGQVARAINTMLGRIEDAFAARDATEEHLRRFVADAGHELRTPLTAVAAYAEMFERGAAQRPDELARAMSGIRTETARMSHLVEDLFLLARLDEGQPLERRPVELVGLAAEAVDAARAVGPAWPVRLDADRPVEVSGDRTRLRQVLDNLLANVRAHTPEGTQTTVRVRQDGATAVVEVSDNGPGMTPEQASRVFERFYRADPSRSRRHGGAGLGLGIVAAIVSAHRGQVTATGTVGEGATFTVRLPATDA